MARLRSSFFTKAGSYPGIHPAYIDLPGVHRTMTGDSRHETCMTEGHHGTSQTIAAVNFIAPKTRRISGRHH